MIRPWSLAHRGVVDAVGLALWPDDGRSRARVLAHWRPGMQLLALRDGWVLLLGASRRERAEVAAGAPLVEAPVEGGALRASTPLTAREREALVAAGARPGDVVVTRGGFAEVVSAARAPQVDPASWIDLGDVDDVPVRSLGRDPPPIERVRPADRPRPAVVGVRLADALSNALAARGVDVAALGAEPPREGIFSGVVRWIAARMGGAPTRREAPPAARDAIAPSSAQGLAVVSGGGAPGLFAQARQWLRSRLARGVASTRLAELLGRRHADYVQRTIDMFRRGDIDEALRHAIRLGGPASAGGAAPPSLGLPSPRKGLTVDLRPAGSTVAMKTPSFEETLRELYRSALAELEAQGRIDEAAFVMAELLRDAPGAVSLLERHERWAAAVALAEAIPLGPEVRARLWVLAGDVDRALLIVRQHGCYAAALAALATTAPARVALTRAWARHLAHIGDLVGAVSLGADDVGLRDEVTAWRAAVVAHGGAAGITMRVQRIVADPAWSGVDAPFFANLGAARGERATRDRAVLADALAKAPAMPALRDVARAVVRPMIHDAARSGELEAREQVHATLRRAEDPLLLADVRAWPMFSRTPLASRAKPVEVAVDSEDRGVTPALDAAWIDGPGMLVAALGEGGLAVLRHEASAPQRIDRPAHQLVAGAATLRALALAPRGDALQVSRVELGEGRAEPWSEVRLDAWSDTWDGDTWVVFQGEALLPVDGVAASVRALREHRPERVVSTTQRTRGVAVAHGAPGCCATVLEVRDRETRSFELWRHDLPAWHLRERRRLAHTAACAVSPDGVLVWAMDGRSLRVEIDGRTLQTTLDAPLCEGRSLGVARPWLAVAMKGTDHVRVRLMTMPDLIPRATLTLGGARRAHLRLSRDWLVIADDRGRVEVFDLQRGVTRRSLRI